MIIITDNVSFTENFFGKEFKWEIISDNTFNETETVCNEIFERKIIWQTEEPEIQFWEYLFICEESLKSQYDIIIKLLDKNKINFSSCLCIAGSGKNFHGNRNRYWESVKGNIHLSALIRPDCRIENFHTGIVVASAVAVIRTIDEIPELENKAYIKWVNDILIEGEKVGGIIAHAKTEGEIINSLVIGIGLNIFAAPCIKSDSIVHNSTCISKFIKKNTISLKSVFYSLVKNLYLDYENLKYEKYNSILNFYRNRSLISGKKVKVISDPLEGESTEIYEGIVEKIGENLELYFQDKKTPVTKGRLIV